MKRTDLLKKEFENKPVGTYGINYFKYVGYKKDFAATNLMARANAIESLFTNTSAFVYDNDLIAGSIRPLWCEKSQDELKHAQTICKSFGDRDFFTNSDHYTPDYERIVAYGIPGLFKEIAASEEAHKSEPQKLEYLAAMKQSAEAFKTLVINYGKAAEEKANSTNDAEIKANMNFIRDNCFAVAENAPSTFAEALQLVWLCHTAFNYENRGAMALGRIDQYLYPLYEKDLKAGTINHERAVELFENIFIKIYEKRVFNNGDDTVNICIGGTSVDGKSDVNYLSYCALEAVRNCNVPGPNLSARVSTETPDEFLDACLKVIGTGLGYPALMNDAVNIKALLRMGYDKKDVYNYTMVGCVENFMTGMQPPWTDGRFDTPRYFEYVLNNGHGILHPSFSMDTGDVEDIKSMDDFLKKFEEQLAYGATEYYALFRNQNANKNPENFCQPFLSLFCRDCIGRALDINMGGSIYPSVHGAALMGIGTVVDSLAAVEKVVFTDKEATLRELADAIKANFEGYEELQKKLLAAPKYGNNDDFADKYAVWFVEYLTELFDKFRTPDGGRIYTAIAANVSNIWAGMEIAATPDGRKAGEPLSDAASPTYGRDQRGATSTIHSITKPDYSKVACGTVINQKFSPSMFEDGKRHKLLTLIKQYLKLDGQEIQINATSRETLIDAMEHPENYGSLVVRVSGFSAFYITLNKHVQLDILNRTQQDF